MPPTTSIVTGAAGFIGSHLTDRLLAGGQRVIGIDNLLLGSRANLEQAFKSRDFHFLEADVNEVDPLFEAVRKVAGNDPLDAVWHLAANSDIRAGTADPDIDLRHTFLSTYHTLKLMQRLGIGRLAFASSSAVYGPRDAEISEDSGPLRPISNYGAMKLASEAVVSAALETWLKQAWIFRFPNVVGSRATHGVIFDFLRKLGENPAELEVLGDGRQEKPYLHVSELVDALFFIFRRANAALNCFNIGAQDSGATVKYIAEAAVRQAAPAARIRYAGGEKGWPGDVPKFRYSIDKLRRLGWAPKLSSTEAVDRTIAETAA